MRLWGFIPGVCRWSHIRSVFIEKNCVRTLNIKVIEWYPVEYFMRAFFKRLERYKDGNLIVYLKLHNSEILMRVKNLLKQKFLKGQMYVKLDHLSFIHTFINGVSVAKIIQKRDKNTFVKEYKDIIESRWFILVIFYLLFHS